MGHYQSLPRDKGKKKGKRGKRGKNKIRIGVDPDVCLSGGTESEGITLDNRSHFFSPVTMV